MQPNRNASLRLTLRDFETSLPFYRELLAFFEMRGLVGTVPP